MGWTPGIYHAQFGDIKVDSNLNVEWLSGEHKGKKCLATKWGGAREDWVLMFRPSPEDPFVDKDF